MEKIILENGCLYRETIVEGDNGELYAKRELLSDPEPTEADDTAAMLVDHEYRLTLLELGLTE